MASILFCTNWYYIFGLGKLPSDPFITTPRLPGQSIKIGFLDETTHLRLIKINIFNNPVV